MFSLSVYYKHNWTDYIKITGIIFKKKKKTNKKHKRGKNERKTEEKHKNRGLERRAPMGPF